MSNTAPKLILDRWQGLGDNLQVSTIPRRMFEKYGEKCVWISDAIFYRNPEIRELVWEHNPYIAGFTKEPGVNYTHMIQFRTYGWIENWERIYNLDPPYSIKPEVYLKESDEDKFNMKNQVILDISYSKESFKENIGSNDLRILRYKNTLEQLASQSPEPFYVIRNKKIGTESTFNFIEHINANIPTKTIEVNSIWEYCNAIKHCKQFICSHSGSHALAAAIRKSCICLIPYGHYERRYFVFDNVRYILV